MYTAEQIKKIQGRLTINKFSHLLDVDPSTLVRMRKKGTAKNTKKKTLAKLDELAKVGK